MFIFGYHHHRKTNFRSMKSSINDVVQYFSLERIKFTLILDKQSIESLMKNVNNYINTPSYFNILSVSDAIDFDRTNFDVKQAQGVILCRLVTQLKAMRNDYPDELTLEKRSYEYKKFSNVQLIEILCMEK